MAKKNTSNKIGAKFEHKVQKVCDQLKIDGIALLSKVPTEWVCIRGAGGRITTAYPKSESKFVDFVGIYNGRSISIETKTTNNKTSFPLSNVKDTQFEYFIDYDKLGGLGYYLIQFDELKKVYLVKSMQVEEFRNTNERKSIPIKWFIDNAIEINYNELNFIDYIA